jgi:uridine kinase
MATRDQRETLDVQAMVLSSAPKAGMTRIIGIDGHGGSGKTTLAGKLARTLRAETIHTDDFASWDNPKDWWPLLIAQVLDPIARGVTMLNYHRSQWWEGHEREPIRNQRITPIMLLEGVSALRREFRPYICFGIYVSAPRQICLERGVARDAAFGATDDVQELWQRYFDDEEKYIARDNPENYANIVVDGSRAWDDQLVLR